MSLCLCGSNFSCSKLQQFDLDVEGEGTFAAGAVEPRDLILHGPGLAQALPDAVALLVEAVVVGGAHMASVLKQIEGFLVGAGTLATPFATS